MPKLSLREATDQLKAFAATTPILKTNSPRNVTPTKPEPISPVNLEGPGVRPEAVADPGTELIHYRPIAQASDAASDVPQPTGASAPPSLAAYLKGVPKKRRRRWESATTSTADEGCCYDKTDIRVFISFHEFRFSFPNLNADSMNAELLDLSKFPSQTEPSELPTLAPRGLFFPTTPSTPFSLTNSTKFHIRSNQSSSHPSLQNPVLSLSFQKFV